MKRGAFVGALWLLPGCIWLNAPDDELLDLPASAMERFCDDGQDNEGDGLIDCADFDCLGASVCCDQAPSTPLDEDWSGASPFAAWTPVPSTNAELPMLGEDRGQTVIAAFPSDDDPAAITFNPCVPMALGVDLEIDLMATGSDECEPDKPCPPYAALVLTLEPDMPAGERLRDELAVLLHGGGLLRLTTNNTEELSRAPFAPGEWVTVRIKVVPLVGAGPPRLRARVTATTNRAQVVMADDVRLTGLERLVRQGDCSQVGGLHLAIEGRGSGVHVGRVGASRQTCVNPSQFQPLDATLMSETLGFDGSEEPWTAGSLGAPTLASTQTGGRLQWDVFAEASDLPPDTPVRVGHAIGHAQTTTAGGPGAPTWGAWDSSVDQKLGDLPPSCIAESCPELTSVREPHLFAQSSSALLLSFAHELPEPALGPLRFGLSALENIGAPTNTLTTPAQPMLTPSDLSGLAACVSLRDPSLIPVDPAFEEGYWLLFSCIMESGAATEVHAVRLTQALALAPLGDPDNHHVVLRAADHGATEIRSPEPVVTFSDRGTTLRVWFLAIDEVGGRSVRVAFGFATGTTLASPLPALVPFPVNPVLVNDSPSLGPCSAAEECTLQSLSVTPHRDDPDRLRFLLARRVKEMSGARRFELVPLEQTWKIQ